MRVFAGISLALTCISLIEIFRGNFSGFEPETYFFGIPFGSFIWGDLFVFSLLWFLLLCVLSKVKNVQYYFLALYSFWLIRSTGETFYWFSQQFSQIINPWPNYYPHISIVNTFTPKEIWVVHQLLWQSISIASLIGLIYTILHLKKSA